MTGPGHSKAADSKAVEAIIRRLTQPVNGQLPRPWMTDLKDPLSARVFIVGRNQRNGFDAARVTHERHIDALFNRNGESCRALYVEVTGSEPSPTRMNTDRFRQVLERHGVRSVLETNVICYASPMSRDLGHAAHQGGRAHGTEIFRELLEAIEPRILIAHGAGTRRDLARVLRAPLSEARNAPGPPVFTDVDGTRVYAVPSLAPPAWSQWCSWAEAHLDLVAKSVAKAL